MPFEHLRKFKTVVALLTFEHLKTYQLVVFKHSVFFTMYFLFLIHTSKFVHTYYIFFTYLYMCIYIGEPLFQKIHSSQGIIQNKSVSGSRTLPCLVILVLAITIYQTKCPFTVLSALFLFFRTLPYDSRLFPGSIPTEKSNVSLKARHA